MIPVKFVRNDIARTNALRIVDAMKGSGQFWKSTRGSILWEAQPGCFNPLSREAEIADVLENGGVFKWEGNPIFSREWVGIARSVNDIRWRLPVCSDDRYLPSTKHVQVRR